MAKDKDKDKESSKNTPSIPIPPPRVSVDDFTEAVFSGVLRAVQAQKGAGIQKPGHIIYGIIYVPEGGQLQVVQPTEASAKGGGE
jgi:hypothetical protein